MSASSDRLAKNLYSAGVLFAVGSGVHVIDHLRRGQGSVSEGLYWAGNLALIIQVTIVVLILTRHRLAPLAAMAGGFPLALGFMAAHWLPEWSDLSDPVWEITSWTALSYVASSLEILGALAVGVTGLAIVRRDGLASFGDRSPSEVPAAP
jgi:hypothetical protein